MEKISSILDSVSVALFVEAFIVMAIWNKYVPTLLGWCELDYYAALGLTYIGSIFIRHIRHPENKLD